MRLILSFFTSKKLILKSIYTKLITYNNYNTIYYFKMNYCDILREKITLMITNDLTIGRTDLYLTPFTKEKINTFIEDNHDNIEKVIQNMINDYSNDNELELLKEPLFDWIGEYLYEFVDINGLNDGEFRHKHYYGSIRTMAKNKLKILTLDLFNHKITPEMFMIKYKKYQNVVVSCEKRLRIPHEDDFDVSDFE